MPDEIERIHCTRLLLVEGKDEVTLLEKMLHAMGLEDSLQVVQCGGAQQFARMLPVVMLLPGFSDVEVLGIIRDADTDARGAFASIASNLKNCGLDAPTAASELTTVNSPCTAVYVMPGGGRPGMLEDMVLESFGGGAASNCVDALFTCIDSAGELKPNASSKRRMQVHLALCDRLSNSIGIAAQKGQVDFHHSAFDPLKDFLRLLCEHDTGTDGLVA